ncbi:MAG TPA: 23S rRNA (pseudouridine(1915)-N(3))-methyltransferase RlmH [Halothiobacillaceae bacterium]|nr:23S rRNA (pseudouridine(1915)-N(3))-methyltransferase RlmH [Halothiobacillaceae bacterium]
MRVEIVAVGRARAGPELALYESYVRRIRWDLTLREVEEKRRLPAEQLKEREGELILSAIPRDAAVLALDEAGRGVSSVEIARLMADFRDEGRARVVFVIGGAEGLSAPVRDRADLLISFGRQTWPHMLVRAMLAEQIYRTQQILAGHPYHRG